MSYSWEQKSKVEILYNILTKEGFKCWMDKEQEIKGGLLYDELTSALINSKVVITCLSKVYVEDRNCNRQLFFASDQNKTILPILMTKDKKIEFGSWPPGYLAFWLMKDKIFITDVYEHLLESNSSENNETIKNFIDYLQQKSKFKDNNLYYQ